MAIQLNTSVRNDVADAVVDAIDAGSTNAQGQLVFQTAANATVALLELNNPAFGSATGGVATANLSPQPADTNAAGGTITKFEIQDRDEAWVIRGTANASNGDILLTSDTIGSGETIQLVSLTYTAPDA